jgi:ComF family protein
LRPAQKETLHVATLPGKSDELGKGSVWNAVRDFFLPNRCPVCLGSMSFPQRICSDCLEGFHFIDHPRCERCGAPFKSPEQDDHLCQSCLFDEWSFDGALSIFFYRSALRDAVHRFKYSGRVVLAAALAVLIRQQSTGWVEQDGTDLMVPVPSRPPSLRRRGFNPPLMLARNLHRPWGLELAPEALRCIKDIESQAGLNRKERRRNVKGAFAADKARVRGRGVLLFDDVFTTGATADECSKVLKRAGASRVRVLTLARTVGWDRTPHS